MLYNYVIQHIGDGTLGKTYTKSNKYRKKKHKITAKGAGILVIIACSLFAGSFMAGSKYFIKKNVVVSAANVYDSSKAGSKTNKQASENSKVTKQGNDKKDTITESKEGNIPDVSSDKSGQNNLPNVGQDKQNQSNLPSGQKVAFLTFDDGPSQGVTPEILNILKRYNIKATFFVIGKMANANSDLLLREKQEGHTIANHTFSHDYKYIYANPKNFVDDLNMGNAVIKSIIDGYNSKLIRFPGGSFGKEREPYRKAVTEAGYHYIDWNALNGDSEGNGNIPADKLVERLKQTTRGQKHLIVLMHDAPLKNTTVQALPQIIEYLKANGYVFQTLE